MKESQSSIISNFVNSPILLVPLDQTLEKYDEMLFLIFVWWKEARARIRNEDVSAVEISFINYDRRAARDSSRSLKPYIRGCSLLEEKYANDTARERVLNTRVRVPLLYW